MKKTILLSLFALATPFAVAAQSSSAEVIEYVFTFVDFKKVMTSAAEDDESLSPEARKMVLKALEAFDLSVLLHEQAPLIEELLPASSAQSCIGFVKTPLAAEFVSDIRDGGSIDAALKKLETRKEAERLAIASFFQSDCLNRAVGVLQSPQFSEAAHAYGTALACNHISTLELSAAQSAYFSKLCGASSD